MGEYLGVGLGAHEHRERRRSRNVRRLDAYLDRVTGGHRPRAGSEQLDAASAEHERVAIGLRLAAGVVGGDLGDRFLAGEEGRRLLDAGAVARSGDRLVVLEPLLTDAVARGTLSVSP